MLSVYFLFFFKQKTAYEMRISDWSSDVCSSDIAALRRVSQADGVAELMGHYFLKQQRGLAVELAMPRIERNIALDQAARVRLAERQGRSEEHTSELQSLMRTSYAVFCLKKKKTKHIKHATSRSKSCTDST